MLEFEGHPISVAIRIPPPTLHQSKKVSNSLIQFEDSTTVSITNPEDPTEIRVFGFNQTFWSFDGYAELQDGHVLPDLKHPNGHKYADQKRVFEHFGKEMVQNAWQGFNSSLICMGESYSGKSWTLFGQGVNKGIIPQFGAELFKTIKDKEKTSGTSPVGNLMVEVKLTMMEVHNDFNKVRDLLMAGNTKYKTVVKLREHPKRGFYVEGLRSVIISNADDLQQRLDEGFLSRASSSTSLNLIPNKTTVVVGLSLTQKYRNAKGDEVIMSAIIDFYDLPVSGVGGSAATLDHNGHTKNTTQKFKSNNSSKSTNPQRTMMKMATNHKTPPVIHQGPSLKTIKTFEDHFTLLISALGNSTLSYSNSTAVTRLLERALSGNCKTFVIFHCTPTETSYEEALSTLMLADKLQRLRTYPVMNEEMTNKLTRELRLEIDGLKKMLTAGEYEKNEFFASSDKLDGLSQDSEEFKRQLSDDIKSQVKDNEREIKILNQSWEEKMKLAKLDKPNDNSQTIKKLETEKRHKAYITNLNPDSQLKSRLLHFIPPGQTDLGSAKVVKADGAIHVLGPGVRELHASFFVHTGKDNKITLKPAGMDCLIKVNGVPIQFESSLFHNDRILFGGSSFWLFQNPREPWADNKSPLSNRITFQFAQEELASKSQFCMQLLSSSAENDHLPSSQLRSEVVKIFPLVEDCNTICDDLERGIFFTPIVLHDIYKLLQIQAGFTDGKEDYDGKGEDFGIDDPREVGVQLNFIKESLSFVLSPVEFVEKYKSLKNAYVQSQEDGSVIGSMNSPNSETDKALTDVINTEVTIGYGLISLKPLAYLIQYKEDVAILDFITLKPIGTVQIEVIPCNEYFEVLRDIQSFLTKPSELLAKSLHFILKIGSVESLSSRFKDITCHYKIHTEPTTSTGKLDPTSTKLASLSSSSVGLNNSQCKYERRFSIDHVTPKLIECLERDVVIFTFYGRQRPKKMRNQFKSEYNHNYYTTTSHPPLSLSNNPEHLTNFSPYLGLIQKQKAELVVYRKAGDRVEQKLGILQTMLELSDNLSQESISVDYLKKICHAKDQDSASESIAAFKEEFTPPPDVEPLKKLTTYQKVSEVCAIV